MIERLVHAVGSGSGLGKIEVIILVQYKSNEKRPQRIVVVFHCSTEFSLSRPGLVDWQPQAAPGEQGA